VKLALTGKAGSGKDYLADYLIQKYGFHRLSFSDQLKKIASTVFNWLQFNYPPEQKTKPLNVNTGFEIITQSPREIWMFFNNLKSIEKHIFVRMLNEEYNQAIKQYPNIIITDIRFRNEFKWCKQHDFYIIGIKPTKQIYEQYEIEKEIDEFFNLTDEIFYNDFKGSETLKRFDELIKQKGGIDVKV